MPSTASPKQWGNVCSVVMVWNGPFPAWKESRHGKSCALAFTTVVAHGQCKQGWYVHSVAIIQCSMESLGAKSIDNISLIELERGLRPRVNDLISMGPAWAVTCKLRAIVLVRSHVIQRGKIRTASLVLDTHCNNAAVTILGSLWHADSGFVIKGGSLRAPTYHILVETSSVCKTLPFI